MTLTRRKRDSDWMDEYRVGRDCPSDFPSEHEDRSRRCKRDGILREHVNVNNHIFTGIYYSRITV